MLIIASFIKIQTSVEPSPAILGRESYGGGSWKDIIVVVVNRLAVGLDI